MNSRIPSAPDRSLKFVFDVAGVLLEWNTAALYDEIFRSSGKDQAVFFGSVFNSDVQTRISKGESITALLEELMQNYPEWETEIRAWDERWDEMLIGAIDGTVSVVTELKERGYSIYVLGNWGMEEFERARARFEFIKLFDDILLSGECGLMKPDAKIFELAERRFELEPAKTIFIDDREDNVQSALSLNWNGIIFENPRQLYLTLMDYGIL